MALQTFRNSFPAARIMVVVLLTIQSCREAPPKTDDPALQNKTSLNLIDSLLSLGKATFDSVQKDKTRKDILARGQQLMQQTEKLAEAAQYKLDTLAKIVQLESRAILAIGDTATARKRLAAAQNIYRRTGNNKSLANSYVAFGAYYTADTDTIAMPPALDSAAHIALVAHDTLGYVKAMIRKARLYLDVSRDGTSLHILVNLLEFQRSQFRVNISQTAFAISSHYIRIREDTTAFRYCFEAIENLYNDSTRGYHHSEYYQQIGYMYYDMANFTEARKAFDKSLELATVPGNEHVENASFAISWIESCYMAEHKYREGIDHMKRLIARYPPTDDKRRILLAQSMLELYMLNGQYAEAGRYATEILSYDAQGRLPRSDRQFSYEIIGKLNMYRNELDQAKVNLLKAYELAKEQDDLRSLAEDSRQLFTVDSAAGRYLDAIGWFHKYRSYTDTRRSRTYLKELNELNIKYATEKRVDSLKTLTERTTLQHSVIEQASFVRNLFVAIAILLVVILIVLFGRYRLRQRVNKQLEENQQKINQQNKALEQLVTDERKLVFEKTTLLTEKTQLLVEKEWLLKEVHHRVKNNLQIMMSLLESQSTYLKNDALLAVEDSQRRIYAMSLIHQKLYQSEDIRILDMARYMREFVVYLKESFDISNRVHFTFDLEPVELSVTQAIPIALIANEAITNSFKYAFPGDQRGEINISLKQTGDEVEVQLADNGIGMTEAALQGEKDSLGMELMKGLTAEIKGTILFDAAAGTKVTIRFRRTVIRETLTS